MSSALKIPQVISQAIMQPLFTFKHTYIHTKYIPGDGTKLHLRSKSNKFSTCVQHYIKMHRGIKKNVYVDICDVCLWGCECLHTWWGFRDNFGGILGIERLLWRALFRAQILIRSRAGIYESTPCSLSPSLLRLCPSHSLLSLWESCEGESRRQRVGVGVVEGGRLSKFN